MKKTFKILAVFVSTAMLFAGCAQPVPEEGYNETEKPTQTQIKDELMLSLADAVPESPQDISDIQLGFNLDLLKALGDIEDGNLFYSPMSINSALTMAYFGAQGDTQKEIAEALGYSDMSREEVAGYQKYLLESYDDTGDTTFTSANSMWVDDDIAAKQSYIDTMRDVFDTLVKNIDLQSAGAADELNSWIDDATNGMIEKLFEQGDESLARAAMVLMNAIYFNGDWTVPFDPERTMDSTFNGSTQDSQVQMMMSNETVMGHKGDGYTSVFLPYGEDERFAMAAVLPDDMGAFVENLSKEKLDAVLSTFEEQQDPVLSLPVFEMEEKIKLKDVLGSLGVEKAFTDSADFSLMSDTPLAIDEVLHKARVKVDEEGTEAAAVTAVIMRATGAMMDRFEFVADRPFLFFIVDTQNDLVMFTGKVMDLD